jgi:hypothetical protein
VLLDEQAVTGPERLAILRRLKINAIGCTAEQQRSLL